MGPAETLADRRIADAPPRACDLTPSSNLSVNLAGVNDKRREFRSSHAAGRGRRMAMIAGI